MFKKLVFGIVIVLMLMNGVVSAQEIVPPTKTDDCPTDELRDWLLMRRENINATRDVLDALAADKYDFYKGMTLMEEHAFNIYFQRHPKCVEEALSLTLYLYLATNQSLICSLNNWQCMLFLEDRIQYFLIMQNEIIAPLYIRAGIDTDSWLFNARRPHGWIKFWYTQTHPVEPTHVETNDNDIQT